ncbi:RdgB/HAM1 family non-canonical purine NTP pyrophosphatase [Marinobacter salicampi]|uniref:RdgB/HAM1 family non-canonical purine NTP pyrophosphatase n=1 Tax=Marinobacter salicampi TaxID=435907 RepID=UPI00140ABE53|nr:RdgB/HAM1 family non-canonical purine NTP pyrophosphatase [Marinobacter salicampi]
MDNQDKQLVIASNNPGKLQEFADLLGPLGISPIAQSELGVTEAEEPAVTFVENAILKARHAAASTGLAAMADDSGLAVDALGGLPGVRSARYAGPGASDQDNMEALLEAMAKVPLGQRQAQYHCVLVYLRHAEDPTPIICHGRWPGEILFEPLGTGGFGYDPVFWLPALQASAAQLSRADKGRLSHRGKALQSLMAQLTEFFPRTSQS